MHDTEIRAIVARNEERRKLKESATPAPWESDSSVDEVWLAADFENTTLAQFDTTKYGTSAEQQKKNAAFIAAARNDPVEADVDTLLAEVRFLRSMLNPAGDLGDDPSLWTAKG